MLAVDVLVLNCGSSSLKFQLFDMLRRTLRLSGSVDRIGEASSCLECRWDADRVRRESRRVADHRAAFVWLSQSLEGTTDLTGAGALEVVAHRVVHGGPDFDRPTRIDDSLLETLRGLSSLAPLHNPANVLGIEIARERFRDVPQVAVFDTAFHRTLPPVAWRYALPESLHTDHGVRRYGFHGASHAYVARRAAEHLGRPLCETNLIALHLGNGCSVTAIERGRSVDTSMGMTPLEGLVMGTRSGDLDPAVLIHLQREAGMDLSTLEHLLHHDSGLKGMAGVNDMRELLARAAQGDERAQLAVSLFCYRARKYIGAYLAVLGHADAIVFTAGIGENAPEIRAGIIAGMQRLGLTLDAARNAAAVGEEVSEIHAAGTGTAILVIRTREELEIARQALAALEPSSTETN